MRRGWALLAVVAVAAAVRLGTWDAVFQPAGVMLLTDSDPHYHVLRAERMLRGAPGAPWRDPAMNWPLGTELLWPPLFDAAIAGAARAVSGSGAAREDIARVAAFVPVALGLATVLLVAALGRALLGRRRGLAAALLVAVLPAHAAYTALGRPDQHAAELALHVAVLLLLARAATRDPGAGAQVASGLGLAALVAISFWTWQGSAVLLAVPVAFAAAAHGLGPSMGAAADRAARAVAAAGLGGAALLAVTVAAFGPPGALLRPAVAGVNGLHVAIAAGAGATGLLLAVFGRAGPRGAWRRSAEAAIAVALPATALLGSSPALRRGAAGGLDALLQGNAWYGNIGEYRPMLGSGKAPLGEEVVAALYLLGLVVPLALAALPAARARWRAVRNRPALLLLGLSLGAFLAAALARRRFDGYLAVAAAVAAEAGIRAVTACAARRFPGFRRAAAAGVAAGALLAVSPTIGVAFTGAAQLPAATANAIEVFTQARALPPTPGREAVLAPWWLGHLVQYYWDRPVVVSPFGVDGGEGAFDAWAAFFFSDAAGRADAAAAARRVGWVVLGNPANEADELYPFAPPGTPAPFAVHPDPVRGKAADATAAFWRLAASRLYYQDGRAGPDGAEAFGGFRLVLESPPTSFGAPGREQQLKVFGAVPGARLVVTGAAPGRLFGASARVTTNVGRTFSFSVHAAAGADGRATLRVPYSTGWNGGVHVDAWSVDAGERRLSVAVPEEAVVEGRTIELALSPGPPGR